MNRRVRLENNNSWVCRYDQSEKITDNPHILTLMTREKVGWTSSVKFVTCQKPTNSPESSIRRHPCKVGPIASFVSSNPNPLPASWLLVSRCAGGKRMRAGSAWHSVWFECVHWLCCVLGDWRRLVSQFVLSYVVLEPLQPLVLLFQVNGNCCAL